MCVYVYFFHVKLLKLVSKFCKFSCRQVYILPWNRTEHFCYEHVLPGLLDGTGFATFTAVTWRPSFVWITSWTPCLFYRTTKWTSKMFNEKCTIRKIRHQNTSSSFGFKFLNLKIEIWLFLTPKIMQNFCSIDTEVNKFTQSIKTRIVVSIQWQKKIPSVLYFNWWSDKVCDQLQFAVRYTNLIELSVQHNKQKEQHLRLNSIPSRHCITSL